MTLTLDEPMVAESTDAPEFTGIVNSHVTLTVEPALDPLEAIANATYARCRVGPGTIKIRPDRKQEWCDALRSGEFRQIRETSTDGMTGRCAMGVLGTVAHRSDFFFPVSWLAFGDPLTGWLGISDKQLAALTSIIISWNDIFAMSFAEIADRIEREF